MRVLILTEDLPALAGESPARAAPPAPLGVGDDGFRIRALAVGLAEAGHRVRVFAPERADAPSVEERRGLRIIRVSEYPPFIPEGDALARTLAANVGLLERGAASLLDEPAELLHAGGWTVVHAAAVLRRRFRLPLVASLLPPPALPHLERIDVQMAWWLAAEARLVVVRSAPAAARMRHLLSLPAGRVRVVGAGRGPDERARRASLARRMLEVYRDALTEVARRDPRIDEPGALRALFERARNPRAP